MIKFFFFFGQLFVLSFFLVFLVSILLCVTLLVCKQKRPKVHNASYFCKPCVDKKARKVKLKNEKHAHHPPNLILSCFLPAFCTNTCYFSFSRPSHRTTHTMKKQNHSRFPSSSSLTKYIYRGLTKHNLCQQPLLHIHLLVFQYVRLLRVFHWS